MDASLNVAIVLRFDMVSNMNDELEKCRNSFAYFYMHYIRIKDKQTGKLLKPRLTNSVCKFIDTYA